MQPDAARHRGLRGLAAMVAVALALGFAGGAVTIGRQYRQFLADQTTQGPYSTVDHFLKAADMGTSEEFLSGIAAARLPSDAAIAFIAPVSGPSRQGFWQTYYIAAYLLDPRNVSVIAWCEPPAADWPEDARPLDPSAASEAERRRNCEPFPAVTDLAEAITQRGVHHVLVAGNPDVPVDHDRSHRVSPRLTLLHVP